MGPLLNTIMIRIYLTDSVVEPAAKYLALEASRRQWPDKEDEEVCNIVAACWIERPVGELFGFADADNPSDGPSFVKAVEYVQQWRLYRWAEDLNKKAVAPSTEFVLQQYGKNIAQVQEQFRPRHRGSSAEAGTRMWAMRWRRRWGGAG